ncbi:MAG: ferritin family protein [Pseudomonadota bacterium]|nr:ferritin family protein [Pseudomonadota bacterium]
MTQSEGSQSGYERIRSKKTLKEILAVATEFERTARDFYAGLAPKVSKNLRWLVDELAEEEQEHFDLFSKLARNPAIEEQIKQQVETPASDGKFSDCIQLPDMGENPDDQSILQYALGREQAAMEQYQSLSESVPEGPIRELFTYLANEETKHKQELEKLYYEVVHSGGV